MAEADGNRTRRGPFDPPPVLKTGEPTRRSVASAHQGSPVEEAPGRGYSLQTASGWNRGSAIRTAGTIAAAIKTAPAQNSVW